MSAVCQPTANIQRSQIYEMPQAKTLDPALCQTQVFQFGQALNLVQAFILDLHIGEKMDACMEALQAL